MNRRIEFDDKDQPYLVKQIRQWDRVGSIVGLLRGCVGVWVFVHEIIQMLTAPADFETTREPLFEDILADRTDNPEERKILAMLRKAQRAWNTATRKT